MNKTSLYFIALIPDEEIRKKIRTLKEEFRDNYNTKHALKSPAHITLQRPFRRAEIDEEQIIKVLGQFSKDREYFKIRLSGFGCFEPRVIFIRIEDHKRIAKLHLDLNQVLIKDLNFAEKEMNTKICPHMTLATRDLEKTSFYKAWNEFKDRDFEADFTVKSLFLLKHNGKSWDVYKEFPFTIKETAQN